MTQGQKVDADNKEVTMPTTGTVTIKGGKNEISLLLR